MIDKIKADITSILPDIVAIRRHLHMHPELAHHEYETREFIIEQLSAIGVKRIERIGTTSVSAMFGSGEMPALAFRADIDALPIQEVSNASYRSQCQGVMHACGHDGHTAILLGLAMLLHRYEASLPRPIKLIFQQAEELTESGAPLLLKDGVLQNLPIAAIYGYHLWPHLPFGTIGLCKGLLMPRTDLLTFQVHGGITYLPGRPIDPNPIRIATLLLNRLNQLIESRNSPWDQVEMTFRTIKGGVQPNQIYGQVEIVSTLRSISDNGRNQALNLIQGIITALKIEQQTTIHIDILSEVRPLLINSPILINYIQNAASFVDEIESIQDIQFPLRDSEDFGHYLKHNDGAYILIGCGWNDRAFVPLHTPEYDFDERALSVGVVLLANLIFLHP